MVQEKEDKPLNSGEKADRDEKGRFIEGNIPKGHRERGTKNYLTLIEEALAREAGNRNEKTYWQKLAEWCYTNPGVAIAILKKFIPDMQKIEHDIPEGRKITIEHIGNNKQLQNKSN